MIGKKNLYIVDALAIAHKCYWAFKDLKTKDGRQTGVVYGTSMFLRSLINTYRPDYLVVCADTGKPTFRHLMYTEYKANRKEKDPELLEQLPDFFKLFDLLGIPLLSLDGQEADDVIGSLVKSDQVKDLQQFIVSHDKDFMQLVNDSVHLFRPLKYPEVEILDPEGVLSKIGLRPDQIIDYLAIVGDAADNIPGVKGVGPKGAEKLLQSYQTLNGVYANLVNIQSKSTQEKLAKSADSAAISKKLATINTSIDIDSMWTLQDSIASIDSFSKPEVVEFFNSLEFQEMET